MKGIKFNKRPIKKISAKHMPIFVKKDEPTLEETVIETVTKEEVVIDEDNSKLQEKKPVKKGKKAETKVDAENNTEKEEE